MLNDLKPILDQPIIFIILALGLDLALGDPVYSLHPIRLIGRLISTAEKVLRKFRLDGYAGGVLLFVIVGTGALFTVEAVFLLLHRIHWLAGYVWHLLIVWQMIALRDLCKHGKNVAQAVVRDDQELSRRRVAMLVGRDTDRMDSAMCCRATVESLSENLTDGVISPLFFLVLFGVPGIVLFKVISTMDSMVGYRNKTYAKFGWFGARMDDVLNFIPARVTWLLMIAASAILPGYSPQGCAKVGWKQHHLLPSPNSGWSEAGAAGALGIKLAGPIWRGSKKVSDIWIGLKGDRQETLPLDIFRMIILAFAVTWLFLALCYGALLYPEWHYWLDLRDLAQLAFNH